MTGEAEKEKIIMAAWLTQHQLSSEMVFPPPLMEHEWEQLRSGIRQVVFFDHLKRQDFEERS